MIKLIPLEKMIYDGKKILLGANKEDVIKVLGEPKNIYENYERIIITNIGKENKYVN